MQTYERLQKKKIVLSSNTSWSIFNFRFGLIKELLKNYEVIIVAPKDKYSEKLIDLGCKYYDIYIDRKGTNPINDLKTFWQYYRLYKKIKPDLIFHYTIKPNIYGTIAAKLNNIPSIAITTGLGYMFINNNIVANIVKLLYKVSFKFAKQVWFLNQDDFDIFIKNKLIDKSKGFILHSEGVNTEKFKPIKTEKKDDIFRFLLIARMIWDKGIGEYVEAAKIIKQKYKNVEFLLLGPVGVDNPTAIPKKQIDKWQKDELVKYLGTTNDVKNIITKVDCVVLSSYREGISRVLLEASAMEKPLIATNITGCKEVVEDGINGYLCKVKDVKDLADKMEKMLNLSEDKRKAMGKAGRKKMIKEFDERIVIEKYLEVISFMDLN